MGEGGYSSTRESSDLHILPVYRPVYIGLLPFLQPLCLTTAQGFTHPKIVRQLFWVNFVIDSNCLLLITILALVTYF